MAQWLEYMPWGQPLRAETLVARWGIVKGLAPRREGGSPRPYHGMPVLW